MRYAVAIILMIFFVIIGMVVFVGRGNNSGPSNVAKSTTLADYENKDATSVTLTQQGRLVGDDQRRAIRVTVTRSSRTVEVLEGFDERVGKSQTFANSPAAFSTFLRALDNSNFGKERKVKQPDERSVCPLGNRFVYRVAEASREVMRTWSDNCATADGPFGGTPTNASTIQQLFRAQITDYSRFTSGVTL